MIGRLKETIEQMVENYQGAEHLLAEHLLDRFETDRTILRLSQECSEERFLKKYTGLIDELEAKVNNYREEGI